MTVPDLPPSRPTPLSEWLRTVRLSCGANLVDVSRATRHSVVDVSRYERGANVPDWVYLQAFAALARVDLATAPVNIIPTAADELAALSAVSSPDGPVVLDIPDR